MAKKKKEKWIQSAINKPGALKSSAKKAGAMTKEGTIDQEWIDEMAKKGGKIGKRARLAKTLKKMHK